MMISVQEALTTVETSVVRMLSSEWKKVATATGCVLYESIRSPIDMPPFRQSAMDGYALCLHNDSGYTIVGEVKAGDALQPVLQQGEAVRIFTGAAVPDAANAVIMQEKVSVAKNSLQVEAGISENDNIRPIAEQVQAGQIALQKGTLLSPAAIGFLTSLGITDVHVYKKPSIAIVVTGNELATAGTPLTYGQIYESNAQMLHAALTETGHDKIQHFKVADDYDQTYQLLNSVIEDHDVVLISGGISVGDYDFVGKALQELKVTRLFYKVKQKPGKPLFFGKSTDKIIFALPGNPAAALSCFYVYVYPALQKMGGQDYFGLPKTKARLTGRYEKKGDRAQFLKANYQGAKVEILDGQSSAMLQSFALANALVFIPQDVDIVPENELVEVLLLPIT